LQIHSFLSLEQLIDGMFHTNPLAQYLVTFSIQGTFQAAQHL